MTAGAPTGNKVEARFDGTTWVDVTADVDMVAGVKVDRPGSLDDPAQPATLTFVLANDVDWSLGTPAAPYTPGSTLSPHHPGIVPGTMVRWSVQAPSGSWHVRFLGWSTAWVPAQGEASDQGTVTVTATDIIGQLQSPGCTVRTPLAELLRTLSSTGGVDIWTLDGGSSARTWRRLYAADGVWHQSPSSLRGATLIDATTAVGGASGGTPDGPVTWPGSVDLSRDDLGIGPVIQCDAPEALAAESVGIWWRLTGDVTRDSMSDALKTDVMPTRVIASGWDAQGDAIWRLVVTWADGAPAVWLMDGAGTTQAATAVLDGTAADGRWHCTVVRCGLDGATVVTWVLDETDPLSGSWIVGQDSTGVCTVVVGGLMDPDSPGGQTACAEVSVGPVWITHDTATYDNPWDICQAGSTAVAQDAASWLYAVRTAAGAGEAVTAVGGWSSAGADEGLQVLLPPGGDRDAAGALAELAVTIGARCVGTPAGKPLWQWPDAVPAIGDAATVTITLGADDDATDGTVWVLAVDDQTTGVTVRYPGGTYVAGDGSTELVTVAGSDVRASAIAAARMSCGQGVRPSSLTVDLATSGDLWAALMAMIPGSRVRVAGLLEAMWGIETWDGWCRGWTETLTVTGGVTRYAWQLDLGEILSAGSEWEPQ